MYKISFYIAIFLITLSCKTGEQEKTPIARVYNDFLYLEDINELLKEMPEQQDSAVFVSSYINQWAKELLIIQKAKINLSDKDKEDIDTLVNRYKKDLLINKYKEAIFNQELDTDINKTQIINFYENNKDLFKLNEELLQLKYMRFSNNIKSSREYIKLFRANTAESNLELLKQELQFKTCNLNDSVWIKYSTLMKKVPFFKSLKKRSFLRKDNYFKQKDSNEVYLVIVKDVLLRNQTTPISHATPIIKQMILHKRRIKLFKKIEETLTEDAIKNKKFQIY